MAARSPAARLATVLPPERLTQSLEMWGFSIIDHAFGPDFSLAVREEIHLLDDAQLFTQSGNVMTAEIPSITGGGKDRINAAASKPGITELDLVLSGQLVPHKAAAFSILCPRLLTFFREEIPQLVSIFNGACPALQLTRLDQMKLQINSGDGACFPMHFDTSLQASERHLTAILYLNPEWTGADGGCLRIYPLPYEQQDIAPLFDRLVLFCSTHMLHRVLPCHSPRYCLSMWFASASPSHPFPSRMRLASDPLDEVGLARDAMQGPLLAFLFDNATRKNLCKILYSDEWEASCREAFSNKSDLSHIDASMKLHRKGVRVLKSEMDPKLLSLLVTILPLNGDDILSDHCFLDAEPQ